MNYTTLKEALHLATNHTVDELLDMMLECQEETLESLILSEVESVTNVRREDIFRKTRKYEIKEARHLSVHFFSKYLSNMSLKEVATYFGLACHSSVIHSNAQVENNLFFEDYQLRYNKIDDKIKMIFKRLENKI